MNREIKFRGQNRLGRFVYGIPLLFDTNKNSEEVPLVSRYIAEDGAEHQEEWIVQKRTIGQYTGLKDKNGNDIYEGDIVKGVSHKFDSWSSKLIPFDVIGVVGYHKEYQTLEVSTGQQSSHIEVAVKGEVIGNIHDNPELL